MNNSTDGGPIPEKSWYTPTKPAEPCYTSHDVQTSGAPNRVGVSVGDRVENWFIRPLLSFNSEDVFVCLMVCLPLIEKCVRYRLREQGKNDEMDFSADSPPIREAASLLQTRDTTTVYNLWTAFRNGLLHRAMVESDIDYILRPEKTGVPAFKRANEKVTIYPLAIRTLVVDMLRNAPGKMWTKDRCPFPEIYRIG
ncbi:MAG TPA: hypothetical protein VIT91_16405 [Chthoniobacterales bacterium]